VQASFPLPYRRKVPLSAVAKFKKAAARCRLRPPWLRRHAHGQDRSEKTTPQAARSYARLVCYIHTYIHGPIRAQGWPLLLPCLDETPSTASTGGSKPKKKKSRSLLAQGQSSGFDHIALAVESLARAQKQMEGESKNRRAKWPDSGTFPSQSAIHVPCIRSTAGDNKDSMFSPMWSTGALSVESRCNSQSLHSRMLDAPTR